MPDDMFVSELSTIVARKSIIARVREGIKARPGLAEAKQYDAQRLGGSVTKLYGAFITAGGDGRVAARLAAQGPYLGPGNLLLTDDDAVKRGILELGGSGYEGSLVLSNADGEPVVAVEDSSLELGGGGQLGIIRLFAKNGTVGAALTPSVLVLGTAKDGSGSLIQMMDPAGTATILMNGNTGDIVLTNADFAEDFDVAPDDDKVGPGCAVIATESGIRVATNAYDTRVIGITSGAGGYKPGLVLDRKPSDRRRMPVALVGKVCALSVPDGGPITPGDLLTTSDVPGHVMRVGQPHSAIGSIVGKALSSAGPDGLISALVTLK